MKAAVTGANGLVGALLVRALVSAGHSVLAMSRSTTPLHLHAMAGPDGYRYRSIDILDEEGMREAIAASGSAYLFHCAVQRTSADTEQVESSIAWSTNVNGTVAAIRAAHAAGVRCFIHSSAMMVYNLDARKVWVPDETEAVCPAEPNGATVAVAEQLARYQCTRYGMPLVILRYPGLYGPGKRGGFVARCIEHMQLHPEVPLRVRSNRRADFLWVGDVVAANLLAIEKIDHLPREMLFHIGSGHSWSVREIAENIAAVIECQTPLVEDTPLPDRDFRFNTGRAASVLGYRPHSLAYGLRRTIAEWSTSF